MNDPADNPLNEGSELRMMIRELPKSLLHTHLEGSIPSETLEVLCRRNKVNLPFKLSDRLDSHLLIGGWPIFSDAIRAVFTCFREAADFSDAVVGYAKSLSTCKVDYAEFHCSPWKHIKRGVSLRQIEAGLMDGISIARNHGVNMKIICDIVRDQDEDRGLLLDWASDLPRAVCPALGISGGFRSVPLQDLRDFCDSAHDRGLRIVVHAGELSGPESVRTSVFDLKADRICHGVRVLEDVGLTEHIVKCGIHLELCPTANKLLGIGEPNYRSLARLIDLGADCSINTDDELFFATSLEAEYLNLICAGVLTAPGVIRTQISALDAAFMSDLERASNHLKLSETLAKPQFLRLLRA